MANSPHSGGPKDQVGRDEPHRRDGPAAGNRGADRSKGDAVASADTGRSIDDEALTRGGAPKKRKHYGHANW